MPVVSSARLRDTADAILRAMGADVEAARIVAAHMMDAHLAGHDSHGIPMLLVYHDLIGRGRIVPNARPVIVRETPVAALVDARKSFGHLSTLLATDLAISKAREHGVAAIGVTHDNHNGRLGHYPERAARAGVALLITVGRLGTSAAPYGGRTSVLGTNPIAVGFPAAGRPPFVLDMATTPIAGGRARAARANGEALPPGVALDRNGNPTTDPHAYFDGGAMLPFGGHKGYGLSLMATLLSSVLVGSGEDAGKMPSGGKTFLLGIDTGLFGSRDVAADGAARLLERVKAVPAAPGFDEVLIPGERAARSAAHYRAEGIPVPDDTWKSVLDLAARLGVAPQAP
jgi:LDH2 family malate/lactate/ureidoglycolate dehydrogenase